MKNGPLSGLGILVTRPAHQATYLAELIRQAGGTPVLFPALEIVDLPDLRLLYSIIDRLDEFDVAIFISPNAVNKALNLIRGRRALPQTLQIAAIGKGSRVVLERLGIRAVIAPAQRFDSEGLLAMPQLQNLAGKRIVIFRGDGGREVLGDELTRRGAQIEYAECYRRQKPQADSGKLLYLWARGELNAVTVTSIDTLRNLFDLVGKLGQQWLKKTPLLVPHARIAETARSMGLEQVITTEAGDEGLMAGLLAWSAARAAQP